MKRNATFPGPLEVEHDGWAQLNPFNIAPSITLRWRFIHLLWDRNTTGGWVRPSEVPDGNLNVVCTCWACLEIKLWGGRLVNRKRKQQATYVHLERAAGRISKTGGRGAHRREGGVEGDGVRAPISIGLVGEK